VAVFPLIRNRKACSDIYVSFAYGNPAAMLFIFVVSYDLIIIYRFVNIGMIMRRRWNQHTTSMEALRI